MITNNWIPVKIAIPKYDMNVIILDVFGNEYRTKWLSQEHRFLKYFEITHWQPYKLNLTQKTSA